MVNNRQQMTVNLAFTADTRAAKAQLADLQRQLSNLVNTPASAFGQGITTNIQEATRAAAELKVHLQNATNVKTGVLDFTKLNQSLQKSDKSLQHYAETLWNIGPQGQQAFMALAESVANAEVPLKRTNAVLDKFMEGLKKTAVWQIQSNITHGFQKALSSAYGYAQDLNDSLNNIRIVTGQNIDQMAKFAEQANKAAKALSTTTTNYTDAALIYYQQGLSDEQVLDRTDITIKMANVAGASAQEVSDQLTAVWNNFYDGSKSLEYYADVMVRLGADTASSSDEISEGLNKFAAVASTVGLSYEYAAAALATVTSETRESADVVGNAYKTLFARIQGLRLGETLDDGTDLNKYSKALESVGINIFNTTGQLKDMDILLEELGTKWTTLNRAQQTALAQTVGGARQYTQIIALMDNWDVFQKNLTSAYGATGSLEEQAEIYAESWRAASDRVRAALESIYDDLINDEAFIDMLDGIEDIITAVDHLIDSFGGLGGVIGLIGSLVTKHLHKNLAQELNNIAYTLKMQTKSGQSEIHQKKAGAMNTLANVMGERDQLSGAGQTYAKLLDAQQAYIRGQDKVTEGQREYLEILMNSVKEYYNLAQAANAEYAKSSERAEELRTNIYTKSGRTNQETVNIINNLVNKKSIKAKNLKGVKDINDLNFVDLVENLETEIGGVKWSTGKGKKKKYKDNFNLKKVFDDFSNKQNRTEEDVETFYQELDLIIAKALKKTIEKTAKELSKNGERITAKELEETVNAVADEHIKENIKEDAVRELEEQIGVLQEGIDENIPQVENWADTIVNATQSVSQLSFGVFSLKGAFETLNNTELSIFERITTALPSLLFGFQSLIVGIQGIADPKLWSSIAGGLDILSNKLVGGTIASTGFWNSTKNLISSLLSWGRSNLALIGTIGLVVIALGILIAAIDSFKESTPEAKLEAARNEAAKLAEEADKAAAALNSIKEAINGYDTVRDKLANCARGTEEWNEALRANNDYVLELLDKYPQLASMEGAIISEGGVLSINEDALTQVQEQAESEAGMARVASVLGNQAVREAEIALLEKEKNKTVSGLQWFSDNTSNDNFYRQFYDSDTFKVDEKKIKEYYRAYPQLLKDLKGGQDKFLEEQIKIIKERANLEKEIKEANEANIKATKAETEAILASVISYNSKVQDSGYASEITQFASQYNNFEERKDKYAEYSDEELKNQLLKYYQEKYGNASLEGDTITYGNGQTYDFTRDSAVNNLVIAEYNAQLEKLVDTLNSLPEDKEKLLYALISGDTTGLTTTEFEKLKGMDIDTLLEGVDEGTRNDINTSVEELSGGKKTNINQFNSNDLDYDSAGRTKKVLTSGTNKAEAAGFTADEYKELAKQVRAINPKLEENLELFEDLVVTNLKLKRGVQDLSKDWEDLKEKFKSTSELDVAEAMAEIKGPLQDIIGFTDDEWDFIDDDFVKENLDNIEDVLNGSEEKLEELKENFAEEVFYYQILPKKDISEEVRKQINDSYSIVEEFNNSNPEIKIGASIEDEALIAAMNNIIFNAKLTQEEATAQFAKMGYNVKLKPIRRIEEVVKYNADGTPYVEGIPVTTYAIEIITANGNYGGGSIGKLPSGGSKGGGGSSSKAEKVDRTKKSDVIERYKEINDSIDDMADALDDANKASDRLYGANRLSMMQQQNEIIQKEIDLIKEKRKEAEKYYAEDREALNNAARNAGLTFTYDSKGNISNYTSEMEKIFDKLAAAEAKMDTLKTKEAQDNYEEKYVKPLQDKIEALKEAIAQYDETRELLEDLENDDLDKQYELQDNNYEQLNYKLEIETELVEIDQKEIDYYVKRLEDKFFKSLEKAQLLIGTSNLTETNQLQTLEQAYRNIGDYVQELNEKYADGDISQEAYVEGLQKAKDEALDNAEALAELDETMANYYQDTVAAASQEIEKFTSVMQDSLSVLESYSSLLEVMGGPKNFERIGKLLKAQSDVNRGLMEVSVARYRAGEDDVARLEQQMLEAEGTDAYEKYRNDWLKAKEESLKNKNEMLAQTQAFVAAEKAILDNALESYLDELDKAMTGGVGVDALAESMERAKSLQEEYLTTTNKIYETNKLMRTAQNAIDATSNTVAKQRLKQFVDETKQLQEKNKLSNYELEIQQAKYDLLLAEIALEEAQNAKSMVRLQRDSEGNFGYVYTADDSAIADAQQNFEDAQNNLYNISLRGQQEYTEKRIQAQRDLLDTLAAINADATLTEEQRAQKEAEAWEFYYEKLEQYGDLYNIAAELDANARADSWAGGIAQQLASNEQLQESIKTYTESTKNAFKDWGTALATATDAIGMDELDKDIKDVKDSSYQLASTLLGEDGLISAIDQEINSIINLNAEYGNLKTTIDELILSHEAMLKELGKEIKTQATQEEKTNLPEVSEIPKEETPPAVEEKKTPELAIGSKVTVKSTAKKWKTGQKMDSWVPGNNFIIKGIEGDNITIGDPSGPKWDKGVTGIVRKNQLVGYDTGGYTGAWGRMGKLAMLHEKELVLNQADTANFLASMDILHNIIKMIDVQATSAQLGGILSSPGFGGSNPVNFEQVVNINANFPNATSSSEIEEALNNLVYNQASQFINRF